MELHDKMQLTICYSWVTSLHYYFYLTIITSILTYDEFKHIKLSKNRFWFSLRSVKKGKEMWKRKNLDVQEKKQPQTLQLEEIQIHKLGTGKNNHIEQFNSYERENKF